LKKKGRGKKGISLGGIIALIILFNLLTEFGWVFSLLLSAVPLLVVVFIVLAVVKSSKGTGTSAKEPVDVSTKGTGMRDAVKPGTASASAARPKQPKPKPEPVYPPEIQDVINEGKRAQKELSRLYKTIPNLEVKSKITELMDVTEKIVDDVKSDPSDLPQIKQFLDYYLPTTIKLLNAYDRMGAQGIQGENISGSMKSIEEMLDTAITAYKKLLDSLFANQALDVETDIEVMNTLLRREGLSGNGSAFGSGSAFGKAMKEENET